MEELFRKVKKGKRTVYMPAGYHNMPELHDGIWLVQKTSFGNSKSNMVYKVGDIKPGADVVVHGSLQQYEDEISKYLLKITEDGSEESKELKREMAGWLRDTPKIYNIAIGDLTRVMLRRLGMLIDEQNREKLREENKLIRP